MEWKDFQPIATLIAAIIAAVISSFTLWKLQDKKRNDDSDLAALNHDLSKQLKEFEQKIINEFATTTEILKWQLSKKATLHRLQAEKEFEIYSKLWNIATELRLAFEEFRPSFDPQPSGTDWQDLRQKRKQAILNSRNALLIEVEKQRPFYSESLYFELRKLVQIPLSDVLDFEASLQTSKTITPSAIERGKKNLNEFVGTLNKVCELIRIRITES